MDALWEVVMADGEQKEGEIRIVEDARIAMGLSAKDKEIGTGAGGVAGSRDEKRVLYQLSAIQSLDATQQAAIAEQMSALKAIQARIAG